MSQAVQKEFGPWRSFLWPIHNFELKKLIPMLIMAFFISFNYTVLRDTKDALIITTADAEAIPWLKTIGVVPAAILFMIYYSKLSNLLTKENLFYATIAPFLVFFGLFSTVIYPNQELLHPGENNALLVWLQTSLPAGWSGLIGCYQYWSYTIFYIMAELWGSAVLSLLFWGFANQTTRVSESKRFYTLFGLGFNAALMFSGPMISYFSSVRKHIEDTSVDAWGMTLNYLMAMVVIAGFIIIATYYWMNRNVLTDARFYDPAEMKKDKTQKLKMGIMESFKFILSSPYLLCLTALVVGYGISINLVEVTWKKHVGMQYPNPNDYSYFMGLFSTVTGVVSFLMMLFVGGNLIRRLGWYFSAMFTPAILTITGLGFFTFVLFNDSLAGMIAFMGTTPLMLAVLFGAAQNVMSKSTKYSLFDPTKEMAYIPLDAESKMKGKAAVDVVGARLGKSGGSAIQLALFTFVGGLSVITPYVALILLVIVALWMLAVGALSKMFSALTSKQGEDRRPTSQEPASLKA